MYNEIKIKLSLDRGMIRLYLPKNIFDERKYIYTGLVDNPFNRELINTVVKRMEYDFYFDRFDYTLASYESHFNHQKLDGKTIKNSLTKWANLKIIEVPKSQRNYQTFINLISNVPNEIIREPELFREWLLTNHPKEQSRRILTKVKAGFDWAVKSKIFTQNIYEDVTKIKKDSSTEEIDPFTKEERDTLLQAFQESQYYGYYLPFVEFLFFTGARPCEAIALTWNKISLNQSILFDCDYVEGKLQEETKTEKMRTIPINKQLREILSRAKCHHNIVFPSPQGKYLDLHNFTTRAWQKTISKTKIRYRVPYNTRHTFITLCLDEGIPVATIASWVGNSPETIFRHYAGVTKHPIPNL